GEWWRWNYNARPNFFCYTDKHDTPASVVEGIKKNQNEFLENPANVIKIIDDGDKVTVRIVYPDGGGFDRTEHFRTQARCEAEIKKYQDEMAIAKAADEAREREKARKLDKYR